MVLLHIGSMPHELTMKNIELFSREVLPAFPHRMGRQMGEPMVAGHLARKARRTGLPAPHIGRPPKPRNHPAASLSGHSQRVLGLRPRLSLRKTGNYDGASSEQTLTVSGATIDALVSAPGRPAAGLSARRLRPDRDANSSISSPRASPSTRLSIRAPVRRPRRPRALDDMWDLVLYIRRSSTVESARAHRGRRLVRRHDRGGNRGDQSRSGQQAGPAESARAMARRHADPQLHRHPAGRTGGVAFPRSSIPRASVSSPTDGSRAAGPVPADGVDLRVRRQIHLAASRQGIGDSVPTCRAGRRAARCRPVHRGPRRAQLPPGPGPAAARGRRGAHRRL